MTRAFLLMLIAATLACAPGSNLERASERTFADAVPLCALLANPAPYVGRRVAISGGYSMTPHGGLFHDERCERGEIPLSREGYEADDQRARAVIGLALQRDRRASVPVVISGILKDHFSGSTPGFGCSGAGVCQRYTLVADSIVAARPPEAQKR